MTLLSFFAGSTRWPAFEYFTAEIAEIAEMLRPREARMADRLQALAVSPQAATSLRSPRSLRFKPCNVAAFGRLQA